MSMRWRSDKGRVKIGHVGSRTLCDQDDANPCRRLPRRRPSFRFSSFTMDYDRKSTVSSFYGGRRTSVDALNRDYPPPHTSSDPRSRRDSSSSFFLSASPTSPSTPQRGSEGHMRTHSAGYNRMSYFDAGREEPVKGGYDEVEQPNEGGWDVFADFNNTGPRYSQAFGLGHQEPRCVKCRSWLTLLFTFFAAIGKFLRRPQANRMKNPEPRGPLRW